MFTGLVESLGVVQSVESDQHGGSVLCIREPSIAPQLVIGESVAVNGACLTVIEHDAESFRFQCGPETLLRTNLGELRVGDRVNLERSLRVGDRLGGHFVQGHVDGFGTIAERQRQGEWEMIAFECAESLTFQMVSKGSIAVDGISLTLVDVERPRFTVMLIPHTLAVTTLGLKNVGSKVNLETDMLAKHLQKMLQSVRPNT